MASPKSTLPNDEKEAQDSAHNPGEKAYRDGMGSSGVNAGLDQLEAHANDPTNHDNSSSRSIRDDERKGGNSPKAPWDDKTTSNQTIDKPKLQKFLGFAKKRGATFGLIGILGIGGTFVGGFLGPSSMLISLMENFTNSNDSSSTSLERRFLKVFGNATGPDTVCQSVKVKCKMNKISNSALRKLDKKGITPVFKDTKTDISKRGYPSKNPASYTFSRADGSKATVKAGDLPGFLTKKENAKFASKLLGARGAFNLKVKAWSGKYITKALYKKFGLNKKGGLADGSHKGAKYKDALAKLRKSIPGLSELDNVKKGISAKINKHLGKAKKGGTGYLVAVAGCISIKAPGYIAAGVAAVQLAQIMPIIMDVVLSPGSKLKASGVDPAASSFSGDDMAAVGGLLTEQTARESDGKMTSALDSPYLQSALGVNTNKLPVSTDYTPGYSVLTAPVVIAANKADKEMAPYCNSILSPSAMYTAMAVDSAVTVAASSTIVLGLAKVVATFAIADIITKAVVKYAEDNAVEVVTDLASSDLVAQAEGEALGDVMGISASAFFASGGMARNLPTLKTGQQLGEFAALQQESANFQRDMDIASLSPFDTTSQYTFLGSIVNNMQMATLTSGSYSGGVLSMLSSAVQSPFRNLSLLPSAGATSGFSEASCGYAADFRLVPDNPDNTPAITMSGLPCTGLTAQQASMTTDTAINLISGEGWLNDDIDIPDDATIYDLVSIGYIKNNTPLSSYIEDCGDASTGDYIFNSASCTIDTTAKSTAAINDKLNSRGGTCDDDGCPTDKQDYSTGSSGLTNGDSMAAMPVFLLDYQQSQMINGFDDFAADEGTTAFEADSSISVFYDEVAVVEEPEDIVNQLVTPTVSIEASRAATPSVFNTEKNGYVLKQPVNFSWRWLPVIG